MTSRAKATLLLYALVALLVIPVFPHFVSPNELSRWALTVSVAEKQTFEVSDVLPLLGPRFEDLSVSGSRIYTNKAPGPSLLAVPLHLLVKTMVGPASASTMRSTLTAMRLLCSSLPLVVLAFLLAWSARSLGATDEGIELMLAGALFATPLFPYSLLFFSHVLVATLLFGAWCATFLPHRRSVQWRGIACGALLGLAVISEYPALFPAAVISIFGMVRHRSRFVAGLVLGALPFALLLAYYDAACFGGVLELSFRHEKLAQFQSVAALGLPSLKIVFRYLFDPNKGLFLFAPILLLGCASWRQLRDRIEKSAWWCAVATIAVVILSMSGYPNWHGGWTVGPRYILAVVPFLLLPLAFRKIGVLEAAAFGISVVAVALPTFTFPFIPEDFPLPWASFGWKLAMKGAIVPNAGHFFGQVVAAGLLLLLLVAMFVVPLGRRSWIGVLAAILVVTTSAALVTLSPRAVVELSYIREVYFEQHGAMQRAMPRVPAGLVRRMAEEQQLPPSSWPF